MNPVLAFSLILCVLAPRLSFGEDFLVRMDGSQLTQKVYNTVPKSIKVKWWEIHYYWRRRDWGASTSKTYDGLMKTVEISQRFDQIWASAINADVESFENHMHPGTPTAVVANESNTNIELAKDAEKILARISFLREEFKKVAEAYHTFMGNWDKIKSNEWENL